MHVTLIPLKIPILEVGQDLGKAIVAAVKEQDFRLRRGDVIAVASKIVSICQGRIVRLSEVRVSGTAKTLARKWKMSKQLAQVVMGEADVILGGVKGFLLTLKYGVLTANAGVDMKNSPPGTATLWPTNPDQSAKELRGMLERRYKCKIGVMIVDSRVTPMRLGTTGLAIGISGFHPVRDERGKPDLYGREIRFTRTNVADDLAASAHLLMGESKERAGVVVVRDAPVELSESGSGRAAKLNLERCLIARNLSEAR
jgi:coenzyme F420-0:L-glutamate ligase